MILRNTFLCTVYLVFSLFLSCNQPNENKKDEASTITTTMNEQEKQEKLLRHMVIFKFNDDASVADVNRLNNAFNALPDSISVIQDFEWGINDSPEDFHQDFTHCYLLTFASEEDRDSVYTPHPAHQAFVERLQPHVEKVFVVDYWTNP